MLWLFIGLAGAYFGVVARGDEGFEVKLGGRDYATIAATCVSMIVFLFAYTRFKMG